jgi:hypothetical protein
MGLFSIFCERAPTEHRECSALSRTITVGEIAVAPADDRASSLRPGGAARAKSQKTFKFLELRVARGNSVPPALAFSGEIV